jgi:hypothetical protein
MKIKIKKHFFKNSKFLTNIYDLEIKISIKQIFFIKVVSFNKYFFKKSIVNLIYTF